MNFKIIDEIIINHSSTASYTIFNMSLRFTKYHYPLIISFSFLEKISINFPSVKERDLVLLR